jgi:hypothetical protein
LAWTRRGGKPAYKFEPRGFVSNSLTPIFVSIVMTTQRTHNPMLWSTVAIALLVAVTAVAGLYWPATYARETSYSRAGGYASDIVDLFVVVPVLLISGIKGYRGSVTAHLVWLGTLGYLLYNFVIYAFGVHFNALFLVYCAVLGLCLYATLFSLSSIPLEKVAQTYGPRAPRKTIALVMFVLAIPTAAFDLRDDVSAILAGRVPQDIVAANQPVNFIHVLDLGFLLPALCVTAVLLWRRKASGYALAPAFLTLLAIMSLELVSIMAVLGRAGFGMSYPMIAFFAVLAVGFAVLLWVYFALGKEPTLARVASAGGV